MNGYNSQPELSLEEWMDKEQNYMTETDQLYAYQENMLSCSQGGVYNTEPEIDPFKYPGAILSPPTNICCPVPVTPHESGWNSEYINNATCNTPGNIFHQDPSLEDWAAQETAFVQDDLNISDLYSTIGMGCLGETNIKVTMCDTTDKKELMPDQPSILLTDQEAFTTNDYTDSITKNHSENEVSINHFLSNENYIENVAFANESYIHNIAIGDARYGENETLSNEYIENKLISDDINVGHQIIDYNGGKSEYFPFINECISIKDSNVDKLLFTEKSDLFEANSEQKSKEPTVEEWAAQEAAFMQDSDNYITNWIFKPSCFEDSLTNQSVSVNDNFQPLQEMCEDINFLNEESTGYQIQNIKSNSNVPQELSENTYQNSYYNLDFNQSQNISFEQDQTSSEPNEIFLELLDLTNSEESMETFEQSLSENSSCTIGGYLNLWNDYVNTNPLNIIEAVEVNDHYKEVSQNADTDTVIIANKNSSGCLDEQNHLLPVNTNWNEKESDVKFNQNVEDDSVEDDSVEEEEDLDYEIVKMSVFSFYSSTYVVKPLSPLRDSDFSREHLLIKIHRLLKLLLPKFINEFHQQDQIKIVVLIGETDQVISTNFVTMKEMTVEFLVKEVDRFCKNKSGLLYFLQKEVYVTVICQITSFSKKNCMLANPFMDVKSKRGVIYISNHLGMSLARAIVVAKAFHDKHTYKELFNCHKQDILANLLHSQANVHTKPCTLEDIPKFESVIKMRIIVWSAGDYNKLVYRGLEELNKRPQLHIWFTYGRYHAVLKPSAFLGKRYYCWRCFKAYSCERKKHRKVCLKN